MRTFTTEHTVYPFDELSEEGKARAIEDHRQFTVEVMDMDYMLDTFKEELSALGYDDPEVMYSGFASQGDGACFTATVDIAAWLKAHKLAGKYRLLFNRADSISITITHNYNYYYATSTGVTWENYSHELQAVYDKLEDQASAVVALIEDEREQIGNAFYRRLEEEYFYQTDDEQLIENIKANEYEFYADGKLV